MRLSGALIFAASVVFTAAQEVTFDQASGLFRCPIANGIYCAGDSLGTDIIIRCTNFLGQPGRCSNNLAGQPPLGASQPARCYASPTLSGVGACEKNCIVYGSSGNTGPDFTLPGCVPFFQTTTSTSVSNPTSTTTTSSPSGSTTTSGTTISSVSVSSPTLGTTSSSVSVSNPTLGTTISTSNSVLTVTGPSYGPGEAPTTLVPPVYNTMPPSYNTTFILPGTTLTYAPPVDPTTVYRPDTTISYIPLPIPTTVTLPDTTFTYGPTETKTIIEPPVTYNTEITYTAPPLTLSTEEPATYSTEITYTAPPLTLSTEPRTTVTYSIPSISSSVGTATTSASQTGGTGNLTYTPGVPSQTSESAGPGPGPTTAAPRPSYTGAAVSNTAGFGLALLCLAAAFTL